MRNPTPTSCQNKVETYRKGKCNILRLYWSLKAQKKKLNSLWMPVWKTKSQPKPTLLFEPEQCKPTLSNMAATSPVRLLKLKLNNVKNFFNLVSQSHEITFQMLRATCALWLLYWTVQRASPSSPKVPMENAGSNSTHFQMREAVTVLTRKSSCCKRLMNEDIYHRIIYSKKEWATT